MGRWKRKEEKYQKALRNLTESRLLFIGLSDTSPSPDLEEGDFKEHDYWDAGIYGPGQADCYEKDHRIAFRQIHLQV